MPFTFKYSERSVETAYSTDDMRLKDLREDADKRQQELAEYLHIRQNTYSQYENGSRQIPIEQLIKLAKFYNVSVDYILELTDEPRPYPR